MDERKYEIGGKVLDGNDALEYISLNVRAFNALKRDGAVTVSDVYERVNNPNSLTKLIESALPRAADLIEYDGSHMCFVPNVNTYKAFEGQCHMVRCFCMLTSELKQVE